MAGYYTRRQRDISLKTHRLFWGATFSDPKNFIIWALTRPLAQFLANIVVPFQVAYGLQAILQKQIDSVKSYALHVLLLSVAYSLLWAIGGMAICTNGAKATEKIQLQIFENFLHKDYEFFASTHAGSLGAQAIKLKDAFNDYQVLLLNGFLKSVIIIGSSLVVVGYYSPPLAFYTLVGMLFILSFTIGMTKWRLKYRQSLSAANSEVAGIIGDALSHGQTVKSFASSRQEIAHVKPALKKLMNEQYWTWMTSIPADVGRMLLAGLTTAVLLISTANLYMSGKIGIAIVVLVQLYVIRLIASTHDLAEIVKTYDSIMSAAYQSVQTMLDEPQVVDIAEPKRIPLDAPLDITFENVSFSYNEMPSTKKALSSVSLSIRVGEKVGIVGYSGSGKTTLTKLLLRFMDVQKGAIKIGGVSIKEMKQEQVRQLIAYVPQEPLLFHRSIKANILYGKPSASNKSVEEAAKNAYVTVFANELPRGLDTLVGEKGIKLSGGERQRVAIARALLKDAPILLLDEATSALDSESETYIQKALWELMKNRTAIVVAHRLSTIKKLDRIIVLDKGSVAETGTHDELIKQHGIYAKLWQHQTDGWLGLGGD